MRLQVLRAHFTDSFNSTKTFTFRNNFCRKNVKIIGNNVQYLVRCSETISSFKRSPLTTLQLVFPDIVHTAEPVGDKIQHIKGSRKHKSYQLHDVKVGQWQHKQ